MVLNILLAWIAARAKEPSTYAGIGAVVAGAAQTVPTDVSSSVQSVVIGLCGLAAIIMRERKND